MIHIQRIGLAWITADTAARRIRVIVINLLIHLSIRPWDFTQRTAGIILVITLNDLLQSLDFFSEFVHFFFKQFDVYFLSFPRIPSTFSVPH